MYVSAVTYSYLTLKLTGRDVFSSLEVTLGTGEFPGSGR